MKRFLFVFGYEAPADAEANSAGRDFESSNAVWVKASSEEEAMQKGREFADGFVARLYLEKKQPLGVRWSGQDFAHWISQRPEEEFAGQSLQSLAEI